MSVIRVLLIDECLESGQFVCDALEEIAETAVCGEWMAVETTHLTTLDDAVTVAAAGGVDVALLNPLLESHSPRDVFVMLRRAAPETPVVLVLPRDEESLGRRLIRDGAQDYLIREELDCAPLARSLRNAIDRQRFTNSLQRGSSFEPVTGFHNALGFHVAATRELQLATRCGHTLSLVLAAIDNLTEITETCGGEQRDLTLLEAADVLRAAAGDSSLLACLDGGRFAALVWSHQPERFTGSVQTELARQMRPFAFSFGWSLARPGAGESLDSLLTGARASLCETMESSQLPDPSHSTPLTASAAASQG